MTAKQKEKAANPVFVQPGEPEPLIIAEPEMLMPQGRRFWTDDSMFHPDKDGRLSPNFSVQVVSEVFFGNGPDWLRWRMRPDDKKEEQPDGTFEVVKGKYPHGYFVLDGEPMQFKRTKAGARYFTLADIERMAHALAQGGHIDGAQLALVVQMVKICSKIHGINP